MWRLLVPVGEMTQKNNNSSNNNKNKGLTHSRDRQAEPCWRLGNEMRLRMEGAVVSVLPVSAIASSRIFQKQSTQALSITPCDLCLDNDKYWYPCNVAV